MVGYQGSRYGRETSANRCRSVQQPDWPTDRAGEMHGRGTTLITRSRFAISAAVSAKSSVHRGIVQRHPGGWRRGLTRGGSKLDRDEGASGNRGQRRQRAKRHGFPALDRHHDIVANREPALQTRPTRRPRSPDNRLATPPNVRGRRTDRAHRPEWSALSCRTPAAGSSLGNGCHGPVEGHFRKSPATGLLASP